MLWPTTVAPASLLIQRQMNGCSSFGCSVRLNRLCGSAALTFNTKAAKAPALRDRGHRSLPRCLIAVRSALDVAVVTARPHPGTALRPDRIKEENAADEMPFSSTS